MENRRGSHVGQLKERYDEMLAQLREERARIDRRIRVLERLSKAAELLDGSNIQSVEDVDEITEDFVEEHLPPRRGRGQGMADAAYEILGSRPHMHASEIWTELEKRGMESRARDPVKMLGTLLGQDKRFMRVGKQTFARAVRKGNQGSS